MNLSIHGRLTALYAAAVLAALTLCGLGLYASVLRLASRTWSQAPQ